MLHEGNVAEMRTGEGKTLVATLPAYLNALPGDGVHIVTVNDYLAQRDSEWCAVCDLVTRRSWRLVLRQGLSLQQAQCSHFLPAPR